MSSSVQVQAYRFGLRRLDSALLDGTALPGHDPNRPTRTALVVGPVLVAVLVAAFAVWGFVRPAKTVGDAPLVLDRDSGTLYVVRSGTLYPALNLASALLAVGSSRGRPSVTAVPAAALRRYPRGPVIGIPGAPNTVPLKSDLAPPMWTACDDVRRTAVLVGVRGPAGPPDVDGNRAVLVRATDGALYLLSGGSRARVSPEPGVLRALGVDAGAARRISAGLLDAIPASTPITTPVIRSAGRMPNYSLAGLPVGSIVQAHRAGGTDYYLLLADGVQRISRLAADLVRFTETGAPEIVTVAPERVGAAPQTADPIPTPDLPAPPELVTAPVLCLTWDGRASAHWRLAAVSALPVPAGAAPVAVPAGGAAQAVYVAPGRGSVVSAAGTYLVTDEGLRYPVPTNAALQMLGLAGAAVTVPLALVALLPTGPALDPDRASQTWPAIATQ